MNAAAPRFSLHRASLTLGVHQVLNDISLTIHDGEKIAIVGPSGAGKTSLLNTLFQQQRAHVALCPQADALVDILSVYHNIYMGQLEQHSSLYNLLNLARPFAKPRAEVADIANRLGIGDKLRHSVDRLSGGQRQRVAIGRALYRQCTVFLGDEPVSSLDPVQSESILRQVLDKHTTVVVTLHDVSLAVTLFDRIIGLKQGAIYFDHPASQVSDADLAALYDQ
ncbi:ATP-binding cassette domain-containing protein [Reinekea sp. G2M2-21]|uniref:ATP-binding cassette domain-containing protein n=1 Tax=Reinekea sp. G2M2-21 TaxID=2788942 RepID=UPI0018AC6945|nr:ATP-binding cassette domain-containing protein [Reinekea sp. G2M2-21]